MSVDILEVRTRPSGVVSPRVWRVERENAFRADPVMGPSDFSAYVLLPGSIKKLRSLIRPPNREGKYNMGSD